MPTIPVFFFVLGTFERFLSVPIIPEYLMRIENPNSSDAIMRSMNIHQRERRQVVSFFSLSIWRKYRSTGTIIAGTCQWFPMMMTLTGMRVRFLQREKGKVKGRGRVLEEKLHLVLSFLRQRPWQWLQGRGKSFPKKKRHILQNEACWATSANAKCRR